MSKRIILARPGQMQRCVGPCHQPWPLDQLDGLGLCPSYWVSAGARAGRTLVPADLMMMASVVKHHIGERGPEDGLMCLLRLLEERLRLVAWEDGEQLVPARCCYCGEMMAATEAAEGEVPTCDNLVTLADLPGAPVLWRCRDHAACKSRMIAALTPKPGRGVA